MLDFDFGGGISLHASSMENDEQIAYLSANFTNKSTINFNVQIPLENKNKIDKINEDFEDFEKKTLELVNDDVIDDFFAQQEQIAEMGE